MSTVTKFPIKRIRTLALVGQAGSGKTTLAEALLATRGRDPGRRQRRARHHGLRLHAAGKILPAIRSSSRWRASSANEHRIHLLDTPGYPDFLGHALPALAAVETAAIVINAQNGIEMMTGALHAVGGEARPRPARHRQPHRRRERRPAGAARGDPGGLRQGMPAAQPARGAGEQACPTASSRLRAKPISPRWRRRTGGSSSRWSRWTRS